MAYFGDATSHAAILGVALALATELPVGLGTLAVALVMAATVATLSGRGWAMDTMLGVLAHSALAFGLVAVSFLPSCAPISRPGSSATSSPSRCRIWPSSGRERRSCWRFSSGAGRRFSRPRSMRIWPRLRHRPRARAADSHPRARGDGGGRAEGGGGAPDLGHAHHPGRGRARPGPQSRADGAARGLIGAGASLAGLAPRWPSTRRQAPRSSRLRRWPSSSRRSCGAPETVHSAQISCGGLRRRRSPPPPAAADGGRKAPRATAGSKHSVAPSAPMSFSDAKCRAHLSAAAAISH